MPNPRGYILHETKQRVVIATLHSENEKTGDMVQVWILDATMSPLDSVQSGHDSIVCGKCPHRGTMGQRSCYVNVARSPKAIWYAWKRGIYPRLRIADYHKVFRGRAIRLGAYGDPAFMPRAIVRKLCAVSLRHAGYTHQWRTATWIRPYVMASCDSPRDYQDARLAGWRTFRVSPAIGALSGEILCPASEQAGKRTTCDRCGLCDGAHESTRKNIYIPVHGMGASKFVVLQ